MKYINQMLVFVLVALLALLLSALYVLSKYPKEKIEVKANFVRVLDHHTVSVGKQVEAGKKPVEFQYTVSFKPDSDYSTVQYLYDDEINQLYRSKKKNINVSLHSIDKELSYKRNKWEAFVFVIYSLFVMFLFCWSLYTLYWKKHVSI